MRTKILFVFAMLVIQACADGPAETAATQVASANPLHWMVGVADCEPHYHAVPEAGIQVAYAMKATYTVTEGGPDGLVRGEWREAPDGVHQPFNWDDTWTITKDPFPGPDGKSGWVQGSYEAHGVGDHIFQIVADGELHGPFFGLLGSSTMGNLAGGGRTGSLSRPDDSGHPVTRGWSGGFDLDDSGSSILNWDVQINQFGTLRLYLDALCVRRPE